VVQPAAGAAPDAVRAALREPLRRMGSARPDAVVLAEVPLSGRVIPMQQSGWGFGMEFVDLDAAAQQQLQTYYQQHAAN